MPDDATDPALAEHVRRILDAHGKLAVDAAGLAVDADLYAAGLTSHASVSVMLACEDTFDTEFEPDMLRKSTFGSIAALVAALQRLGVTGDDAVPAG